MLNLQPVDQKRAQWKGIDVGLTRREFDIVCMLASDPGQWRTSRHLYDLMHYPGFQSEGYKVNVRSMIKRIRNKFRKIDKGFDEILAYSGVGYSWKKGRHNVESVSAFNTPRGRSLFTPRFLGGRSVPN